MMFQKAGCAIAFSLFLLCPITSLSQTGPGGVGSSANNAFWIKADAGTSTTTNGSPISIWQDVSGNGNDVSQATLAQQPLYSASVMNGYPAVQFDFNNAVGQNDYLSGVDAANLDNTNGLTIFTVIRPTNLGSARSIVAKRTNVGVNQAYMFFFFTSDHCFADIVSNDNRFSTNPVSYPASANYIFNLHYDGTLAAASRAKLYVGETLVVTASETASSIPDYNSPLIVGATHVGDNRAFGGYMAEIIIYREALSTSKRIIVDNYLSAKYDIALASNDVYTMDNAGNGNYDHDVAGIGRESVTDLNSDARGSGIVRILNPSSLADNEYMMWGHDNGILQAINSTDIPAGIDARFDRVWRVSQSSKTGAVVDVGAIDMQWDLNGLGPVTAADLRLLIDTDNDGFFADETPISGAISLGGGIYGFSAVSALTNQRRFTLATINVNQTPLPVELVNFSVEKKDQRSVLIEWQTKSELNCDYFIVQHSSDGQHWSDKFQVPGAGNSSELIRYQRVDETPLLQANYYRLKQVDFDGNFEFSETRYVNFSSVQIQVFPNPSNGQITITGISEGAEFIHVRNALGQLVESVIPGLEGDNEKLELDLSVLPPGIYFVETAFGSVRLIRQ